VHVGGLNDSGAATLCDPLSGRGHLVDELA
jgi:hypothetical protein